MGVWATVAESSPTADQIEQLAALGYVTGEVPAGPGVGVARHDVERTQPGLNLVTSAHAAEATLMDNDGRVLHTWALAAEEIWPDVELPGNPRNRSYWRRVAPLPDGDLIVIFEAAGLARIGRDSSVVWALPLKAHHDVEVLPDGSLMVLALSSRVVPDIHPSAPVIDEWLVMVDPDGRATPMVSILDALLASDAGWILGRHGKRHSDILHTNELELLDDVAAGRIPGAEPGDLLVSLREPSALAVIDLDEGRAVWASTGDFELQHDPDPLPTGRLLLFDNGPEDTGRSRVLELDPATGAITWSYDGERDRPLSSRIMGTNQRLENGNTLITESVQGRALEVTPDGEVVWEYLNPHRAGEDDELVALLPEVVRIPRERVSWLSSGP